MPAYRGRRYPIVQLYQKPPDTAAEIGSTGRSSARATPSRQDAPFPLHDGARWRGAHLLAKSPDWLKAAPMRENMRTSWRQSEQKKDHCPSLLVFVRGG